LRFEKDGPYAIRSGSYVISKNITGAGTVYMAYRGKDFVGRYTTADEAKTACAADNKGAKK
jgi:hypothetical protein